MGGVVVVAHVKIVSAQGPNPSISFFGGQLFNLRVCWDLDLDLDQGLTIFESSTSNLSPKALDSTTQTYEFNRLM